MNSYDYIIVGAGTAGCLLANRLSADGKYTVLLVEAGSADKSALIKLPIGFGLLYDHAKLNWRLQSEPEPELNNRQIAQPRGKVLGGSSAINGMMYVRGQKQDYDGWAALGNSGWSYEDVLPFFLRSEDHASLGNQWHKQGGDWPVGDARYRPALAEVYLHAAEQAGIPRNPDINAASQRGIDYTALYQKNGSRVSSARAFLSTATTQPNLTIVTDAVVQRIRFKGTVAQGIDVLLAGELQSFEGNRETLLCAGSFHSPQLLQLSGIGAPAELGKQGISIVHSLPGVGRNLQEHLGIEVSHAIVEGRTLRDEFRPDRLLKHAFDYLIFRKGLLTFNGALISGFTHTDDVDAEQPNCQLVFSPAATDNSAGMNRIKIVRGVTSMAYPLRPDARGSVTLRSANAADAPVIRHNFLHSERDRRELINSVKLQREIFRQNAFAYHIGEEQRPGPQARSDDDILQYIRQSALGCYHPVGSCRMGKDEDAVVDAALRVHGIEKLRVIDGSVMPNIISGNTNAAITMIAEKAAALILRS